jgi:MFS transporter, PAT family, beta-lactamase induction signal transducer AmpG
MNLLDKPAGRTALFALLYASEGAPIGFIWWALPTILRSAGVPVLDITGLTAVLVMPWAFKFTWAPLVDALRSSRWNFRSWIASAQSVMALSLLPLVWLDPIHHLGAWRALLLLHAIAAATQDVAIDALAINTVPKGNLGALNGAMQAGMLVGRSLFGGGALLVATWLGRPWIVGALIGWILLGLLLLVWVREPAGIAPPSHRLREFRRHLGIALGKRATWFGLAFALTSAAAFEATGQLAGPYMVDRGIGQATIGWFFGVFAVGATLVGGLIGGVLSDRWGRTRAAGTFLVGFVTMIVLLALAELGGAGDSGLVLGLLTGMYFFIGLFTAASYALFMDLTDPGLGATEFSTFMSATNACESWSAWTGGRLVNAGGYPAAFLVMSVVSLLSLPLLRLLGPPRTAIPASAAVDESSAV